MREPGYSGRVTLSVSVGLWLVLGCPLRARDAEPVRSAAEAAAASGKREASRDAAGKPLTRVAEFQGKKIASLTGTAFDVSINRVVADVTHVYFNDSPAMIQAVLSGKVDAWAGRPSSCSARTSSSVARTVWSEGSKRRAKSTSMLPL